MMLCDNLEGWEGRVVVGLIRGRGHVYTYGRFLLMYGKNHHDIVIILQLKIIYKKRLQKGTMLGRIPESGPVVTVVQSPS